MALNIVFYKIATEDYYWDFSQIEDSFISSIRLFMPDAVITQLSDMETPAVKGVDRVMRSPHNYRNHSSQIHYIGFRYLSELDIDEFLLSDMDMLYNADVSQLLEGDFDVAVCPRGRHSGRTSTFVNDTYPYPSIIVSKNAEFWCDCYSALLKVPRVGWHSNMKAVGDVVDSGKYAARFLEGDIYNRMPHHKDDYLPEVNVYHFKGRRVNNRRNFMNYFYEKHIARTWNGD